MIHEQLVEALKHLPGLVLAITKGLVEGADENRGDQYMFVEHPVPQVIAVALDIGDTTTAANAAALLHELGERSYIDLADMVAALGQR
ncbi:hypothetical protein AU252_20390 [Pseudarthrobacter sulfonivorans]|uniref:Uncharacterized protein n=2 Tax=Pseudarthrobacter sulfonivorans TaxID=121292 RepID=A0A0U3QNW9_9MICC|nr:hypothetical protein AU252_20390 [Pseudarthrobacter sulfonivorans]